MRVAELFAGVGGFRIGLERASTEYNIVWSNQWEPNAKKQHASEIYVKQFGGVNHSNTDISKVNANEIPDFDLLVGGFPCQDYSVAKTLNQSQGIQGKKGVLWWDIYRIAREKKPSYLLLENVDRLLISPSKQRGKDFSIILASLNDLGYAVEWRVINAADYGMPQRRKRVFIFAYRDDTDIFYTLVNSAKKDWILKDGFFASAFEVTEKGTKTELNFNIKGSLDVLSETFSNTFHESGFMINRNVYTLRTSANYTGPFQTLGDILLPINQVPKEFFINNDDLPKWVYQKGSKHEQRYNTKGDFFYKYSEGAMAFPDSPLKPSRTIITGEGGKSPSRFKHVVIQNNKYRRLTPIELERLNMFPDNHTLIEGISDVKRAFLMGNALVIGIIEKLGIELLQRVEILNNAIAI